VTAPDAQADPVDTANPARSSAMTSVSPETPGKATLTVFGKRRTSSP
jgi:hypothetical protein